MGGNSEPSERHCSHLVYCLVVEAKIKGHTPFVLQRREAMLEFPVESEFHGLQVRAKLDVDLGTFLQFQKLGESATPEESRELFEKFGSDIVLEWNMHDEDGKPVPANAKGFLTLPPSVCVAIVTSWAENVSAVGEA